MDLPLLFCLLSVLILVSLPPGLQKRADQRRSSGSGDEDSEKETVYMHYLVLPEQPFPNLDGGSEELKLVNCTAADRKYPLVLMGLFPCVPENDSSLSDCDLLSFISAVVAVHIVNDHTAWLSCFELYLLPVITDDVGLKLI